MKTVMRDMPKEELRFVIPSYNEAANLPHLLNNIRKFLGYFEERGRVFVVDDGSSDESAAVVERLSRTAGSPANAHRSHGANGNNDNNDSSPRIPIPPPVPITLIRHSRNRGPGAAFLTGFKAALQGAKDRDFLVTIEADNTSDLCILNKMLEHGRRGSDVVLASVYGEGRVVGAPIGRRVLSWCATTLVKLFFRFKGLNTFSSFFRLYRVAALRQAFAVHGDKLIEEPGFVCMVELLVKLDRLGLKMSEVPMLLDSNIRIGDSKMKVFKTGASYLRVFYNLGIKGKDRTSRCE